MIQNNINEILSLTHNRVLEIDLSGMMPNEKKKKK